MSRKLVPVVLCGGSGSRLWPISRASFPKQYLSMDPKIEDSFLQLTLKRLKGLAKSENPIILCNEEHRFITAEQLRKIKVKPKSIILEPFGKNTAPAVALAALNCLDEDPLLLVMPSDHKIFDISSFLRTVESAKKYAEADNLLTFGISPNNPETGYGYIKSKKPLIKNGLKGEEIEEFIEKPSKEIAEKLIQSDYYNWNSGIYLFKASTIINEIEKYSPDIISSCRNALKYKTKDLYFEKIDKESFQSCPNISIDNAVMEKTRLGIVFSLDVGWSDIGGWKSFWENSVKDENGNALFGNAIGISAKNNLIRSEKRLVLGLGIEDLIIVETNDAILVSKKDHSENVKGIVDLLKKKGKKESVEHTKGYRPWGNYITIEEGAQWKVKKIEVNPGGSLSLQMHKFRSEHWVIVSGVAQINIEDKIFNLKPNESCYVPKGKKHRLSNQSTETLIVIEVQIGEYLEEDDIYRYDDKYGRSL